MHQTSTGQAEISGIRRPEQASAQPRCVCSRLPLSAKSSSPRKRSASRKCRQRALVRIIAKSRSGPPNSVGELNARPDDETLRGYEDLADRHSERRLTADELR
jgi:hypothetical protein